MYEVFEKRYNSLNEKQKAAVNAVEGPVLVVAGPGSGKTELLSLRISNIIKIGLAKPENILALTFTESACKNMQARLFAIMGKDAYRVPIFTFHSFCTNIISRYPEFFFDAHTFEPISDLKQNEILSEIFSKLRYGNPLYGYHEERGYSYFRDVAERIKNFKEAGLSADDVENIILKNKDELDIITPILRECLPSRVTKETLVPLISKLSLSGTVLGNLYANQIEDFAQSGKLGDIKSNLLAKEKSGVYCFKEEKYTSKYLALAEIYREYQASLWKKGYFDFNDMILYVKNKLMENEELRAEVEETYQYILVDEFQDTNNSQLELIKSITSNPVLEGKANVFVVGDDDQSIYKFQGALLSNIFNFKKMYKDVDTIVLTDNYRSSQKILDFAKSVIDQGEERLVKKDTSLTKDLVSKNPSFEKSDIFLNEFKTKEEELLFVSDEIKQLIQNGVNPEEIAVITRKHSQLQELLPFLDGAGVSYNYERKESVFDQKHIEELVTICAFLESVANSDSLENDELLSKILSFKFLDISRIDVWEISRKAYLDKKSWLATMLESDVEKIKSLAMFFVELGVLSKDTQLEIILDILIGSKDINVSEGENEDEYYHNSIPKLSSKFVSPYKDVYFGKDLLEGDIASYIHFLSSLRVFIYALREYKKGEKLLVSDLSKFISLHKEYGIALLNKTSFAGDAKAVHLMTAHKAKGLEFEYVFIVGSENGVWIKSKISNKLPLPKNMPFDRKPDTQDDFLRLFFVALTRAKHTLYLTYTDNILPFISDVGDDKLSKKVSNIHNDKLINGLSVFHIPPFAKDEKALLNKTLEGYKLSPTHLGNFLNLSKGGPKLFLEQNLLRFPQSKSSSSVYGSAVHKAIEIMYISTKKNGVVPSLESVLDVFKNEIIKSRLLQDDETDLIGKGIERLTNYYNLKKETVLSEAKDCITEVDFNHQNIILGEAHLTGKIDRLKIENNECFIVDIKSGKSFSNFDLKGGQSSEYEDIKKLSYKYQLMMYKILLENSRDYQKLDVKMGELSFVDDEQNKSLILDFESISGEEFDRFKKLLQVVYSKIISLDFPDVSKYSKDYKGILEFEDDLVNNRV